MFSFWITLAILALTAALDAVWWVLALRLTRPRGWRIFISLFMAVQLAAVLSILGRRDWLNHAPQPVIVAVNLWHHLGLALVLVILPPLGVENFKLESLSTDHLAHFYVEVREAQ